MVIALLASSTSPFRRRMNAMVAGWRQLFDQVANPYRPELHYMRGPAPKWLAKQRREYNLL